MSVQTYLDDDTSTTALQERLNEFLRSLPDEDIKNLQLSSHNTMLGLVHVARVTYQTDDEDSAR